MYKVCETTATRKRFLTKAWNWFKGVISDKVKRCQAGAEIYYNSVDYFGHVHYASASPAWCNDSCTKGLGDPNKAMNG